MDLVEQVYVVTRALPREEVFALASQIRRAAVSVPSNIAEGHTREYTREYLHHISVAQASLAELDTQLEIAVRLAYLSSTEVEQLKERIASIGRQLYALRNAVTRNLPDPRPLTPDPQ
jgi:four helix bundle protein